MRERGYDMMEEECHLMIETLRQQYWKAHIAIWKKSGVLTHKKALFVWAHTNQLSIFVPSFTFSAVWMCALPQRPLLSSLFLLCFFFLPFYHCHAHICKPWDLKNHEDSETAGGCSSDGSSEFHRINYLYTVHVSTLQQHLNLLFCVKYINLIYSLQFVFMLSPQSFAVLWYTFIASFCLSLCGN